MSKRLIPTLLQKRRAKKSSPLERIIQVVLIFSDIHDGCAV